MCTGNGISVLLDSNAYPEAECVPAQDDLSIGESVKCMIANLLMKCAVFPKEKLLHFQHSVAGMLRPQSSTDMSIWTKSFIESQSLYRLCAKCDTKHNLAVDAKTMPDESQYTLRR